MTSSQERAARLVERVTAAALVTVVLSGVGLLVAYRPSTGLGGRPLSIVHVVSVVVLAQGVVAGAIIALIGSARAVESGRRLLSMFATIAFLVVAAVTGSLLAWDQLALRSVTVDTDVQGFGWVLDDSAKFVIIADTIVSIETVQRLLIVHSGSAVAIGFAGVVAPRLLSAGMPKRRPVLDQQ